MGWAQALGLGLSALGMFQSNKAQGRAEDARDEELAFMREDAAWRRMMADKTFASQEEENDYQRKMERLNRRILKQERRFGINQYRRTNRVLDEEREFQIDRMVEKDREQARLAQQELEQYLRNKDITEAERKFAVARLDEAKAVAAGEREEDLRRFYEERAQAEEERAWVLEQFYSSQDEARKEQGRDLAIRDRILGQVDGMQSALERTLRGMGDMPEVPEFSERELMGEIDRRTEQYQGDVERAAEIASSQNEANLIRAGLDSSTPGTARRSDVARRIADELQSARSRAYDDALGFITGKQGQRMNQYNAEMGRRGSVLDEVMGVKSAGMGALQQLPGYKSLADQVAMATRLPSGVYSRGIGSANDYRAPVGIGSAVYEGGIKPRLSNYEPTASRTNNAWQAIGSAVQGPYDKKIPNSEDYSSAAGLLQQEMFGAADDFYTDARDRAQSANAGFGKDLRSFLNDWETDWGALTSVGRGA